MGNLRRYEPMSITLTAAVGVSDPVIHVSGGFRLPPGGPPLRITVDSEDMYVSEPDGLVWQVTRGANLTSRAPHAQGANVSPQSIGAGGGSISVTDGTTTVDPATSLHLPAGTLSDLGSGEGGVGLVFTTKSVPIAYNTPGLNAPTDAGAAIMLIPAGSIVTAFLAVADGWSEAGELILFLSSPDRSTTQTIAGYTAQGDGANAFAGIESVTAYPGDSSALRRWAIAVQDCVITAAFYPTATNPNAGSGVVYAIIATPAA
jgi:hypothetical protein